MWSNPAFLFLQEPLVHKQLSLITKTSLRGLDDSQLSTVDRWRELAVAPLAHRTVRRIIAERVFKFPRVAGLELYGPGAPDTVRWHTRQSVAPFFSTLKFFAPF
jgi:hypothetical protein